VQVLRTLTLGSGLGLALLLMATGAQSAEAPRLVTTLPPIHSLVAAVAEGATTPHLLLRGGTSPHTYTMAPSDARTLQNADLVVWVGPSVETFMVRALRDPRPGRRVLTLKEGAGVIVLETRKGGIFETHDHDRVERHNHDADHAHADEHDHDEDHAHDDEHDHDEDHAHDDVHDHKEEHGHQDKPVHDAHVDGHLWLDPKNALRIVELTAEALIELDPGRAAIYRANAARAAERLSRLDAELATILNPVKDHSFIVFHDAYQYFERRYGLTVAGSITVAADRKPGARRLREIRDRLTNAGAACVFAEPQFPPDVVATVVEGTGARKGTADPLGAALEPGPDLYPTLMRELARSLAECLSPQS